MEWEDPRDRILKFGTMYWHVWNTKRKIFAFVFALALYMYILYVTKTAYMRGKRLDTIDKLALKNEKLINHIHEVDHRLNGRLIQLDDFLEG